MAQSLIDFFAHIPGIGWIFRVCFLTISNALGFIISDPVKFLSYITAIPTLWTNRKKVKDVSRKIKRNFAKIKCWRRQSITKKIYFFSDINEESLQLALDITNYFKKFDKENIPLIIFYKGNENYDESKIDPDFLVYCEKKGKIFFIK